LQTTISLKIAKPLHQCYKTFSSFFIVYFHNVTNPNILSVKKKAWHPNKHLALFKLDFDLSIPSFTPQIIVLSAYLGENDHLAV
jgi:hypothetical protein